MHIAGKDFESLKQVGFTKKVCVCVWGGGGGGAGAYEGNAYKGITVPFFRGGGGGVYIKIAL